MACKGQCRARRDAGSSCTARLVRRRALLDRGHCALWLHTLCCGRRIRSCRLSGSRRMAQAGREPTWPCAAPRCLVTSLAIRTNTVAYSGSVVFYHEYQRTLVARSQVNQLGGELGSLGLPLDSEQRETLIT